MPGLLRPEQPAMALALILAMLRVAAQAAARAASKSTAVTEAWILMRVAHRAVATALAGTGLGV